MSGTEVPVFLLLAGGSNIAGWRQQYCWLEAAIGDQPVLYRQTPYAEPTNGVSCTRRNDNYAIQSSTGVLQRMVERKSMSMNDTESTIVRTILILSAETENNQLQMTMKRILLFLMALLTVSVSMTATDYFVSTTSNDTNNGLTRETAFICHGSFFSLNDFYVNCIQLMESFPEIFVFLQSSNKSEVS